MESKKAVVTQQENQEKVKLIQWEDFQQELARMSSLSSALNEVKQKKLLLQQKLESLLQRAATCWAVRSRILKSVEPA